MPLRRLREWIREQDGERGVEPGADIAIGTVMDCVMAVQFKRRQRRLQQSAVAGP